MKKVISSLLFAILVGTVAAFFRPMAPYQVVEPAETSAALFVPCGGASSKDAGLDNPNIADDQNISPARKCGFCMGVSTSTSARMKNIARIGFQCRNLTLCGYCFLLSTNFSEPGKPTVP